MKIQTTAAEAGSALHPHIPIALPYVRAGAVPCLNAAMPWLLMAAGKP